VVHSIVYISFKGFNNNGIPFITLSNDNIFAFGQCIKCRTLPSGLGYRVRGRVPGLAGALVPSILLGETNSWKPCGGS